MKKKLLFSPLARQWNALVAKFYRLYQRISSKVFAEKCSEEQQKSLIRKLQTLFARLEKMQYQAGIKIAGTSLVLMFASATSFAQLNWDNKGNMPLTNAPATITAGKFAASPGFCDLDNDGDLDLFAGSRDGNIKFFQNIGTSTSPTWAPGELLTDKNDHVIQSKKHLKLAFADVDGDGYKDLFFSCGNWGKVYVYKNDGAGKLDSTGVIQPMFDNYLAGDRADKGCSQYMAPSFADIDKDGDLDMYVGEYYGKVFVYKNDGAGNFTYSGDLQAGGVDIVMTGAGWAPYAVCPAFADLDKDGDMDLYIGDYFGVTWEYKNNGGVFEAGVKMADIAINDYYSKPAFADLDGDGNQDMYVGALWGVNGNAEGDIRIVEFKNTTPDLAPPTIPIGLSSSEVGSSNFKLSWTASELYPVEYEVFKDGVSVGKTATTSINLKGLDYGVTYSMTVKARDIAGNWSDASAALDITTKLTWAAVGNLPLTNAPATITAGKFAASPGFCDIDNDGDLDMFGGCRDGNIQFFQNIGTATAATWAPGELLKDKNDHVIQSKKHLKLAFADVDGDGYKDLYFSCGNWGKVYVYKNDGAGKLDSTGVIQPMFDNYMAGDRADKGCSQYMAPSFADIDKDGDLDLYIGEYYGKVFVYKNDGTGKFTYSGDLQAGGVDIVMTGAGWAPYAVCPAFADLDKDGDMDLYIGDYFGVTWEYKNNGGVFDAGVKMNDIVINDYYSKPAFADLDGDGNQDMYVGTLWGVNGNAAGDMRIVEFKNTTIDVEPPTVPAGLSAKDIAVTAFTLNWEASDLFPTEYEVFKDGISVGKTATLSLKLTGLKQNTTYSMTVKASDAAGNWSEASTAFDVTTISGTDIEAPTKPTNVAYSNLGGNGLTLTWDAASDNVGVTMYEIFKDGVSIGTATTLSFDVTGLTSYTEYSFTVTASDLAQNASIASTALVVKTLDNVSPTAPSGLSTSAVTAISFTLSWVSAADIVGVTEYEVFKDGVSVGTTSATSISVTGLSQGKDYTMTVKAKDAAGNVSEAGTLVAAALDTEAPSVPAGLSVTDLTATSFVLNWNASTDNRSVKNYQVFKNGTFIGVTASTSLSITNLSIDVVYAMTVLAVDPTGNKSAKSAAIDVTTLGTALQVVNAAGISIYPNPAREFVKVDGLKNGDQVKIINATGQVISTNIATGKQAQLNLNQLKPGVYLMQVDSDGQISTTKFIKR